MKRQRMIYNMLTTVFALAAIMSLGMITTLGVIRAMVHFAVFALLTRDSYLREMSCRHRIRREKRARIRRAGLVVTSSAGSENRRIA